MDVRREVDHSYGAVDLVVGFKACMYGSPMICATKSVGYVEVATPNSCSPWFVENCTASVAHLMAIGWEFERCVPKIEGVWNSGNEVLTCSNLRLGETMWLCVLARY